MSFFYCPIVRQLRGAGRRTIRKDCFSCIVIFIPSYVKISMVTQELLVGAHDKVLLSEAGLFNTEG